MASFYDIISSPAGWVNGVCDKCTKKEIELAKQKNKPESKHEVEP